MATLLRKILGGRPARPGPVGPDELERLVVAAITGKRSWGRGGRSLMPGALGIRVRVPPRQEEATRTLIEDPEFAGQVDRRLLAEIVGLAVTDLPLCMFEVEPADVLAVETFESPAVPSLSLFVRTGDCAGARLELPPSRAPRFLGRGDTHGGAGGPPNHLVLTREALYVSRASALIQRSGQGAVLALVDQGRELVVVPVDGGAPICPAATRSRQVAVGSGDEIHLTGPEHDDLLRLAFG